MWAREEMRSNNNEKKNNKQRIKLDFLATHRIIMTSNNSNYYHEIARFYYENSNMYVWLDKRGRDRERSHSLPHEQAHTHRPQRAFWMENHTNHASETKKKVMNKTKLTNSVPNDMIYEPLFHISFNQNEKPLIWIFRFWTRVCVPQLKKNRFLVN